MKPQQTKQPQCQWVSLDSSFESTSPDTVSLLSYNVLAPTCCDNPALAQYYKHVPKRFLSWEYRCSLLFEQIRQFQCDVVCLQEIEFSLFDDTMKPIFESLGYASTVQSKKAKGGQ